MKYENAKSVISFVQMIRAELK